MIVRASGAGDERPAREVVIGRKAARDLRRIADQDRGRILDALERFAETGYGDVKQLTDVRPPAYRLRVGSFRVLFALEPGRIEVERVLDRRDAY